MLCRGPTVQGGWISIQVGAESPVHWGGLLKEPPTQDLQGVGVGTALAGVLWEHRL